MQKAGLNVEYVATDWGTLLQRRNNRGPVEHGGWSAYASGWSGLDEFNPAVHLLLRAQGADGFIGWPNSPKLEALRGEWFAAPDLAAQQAVARQMQIQAFQDLPYIPMGQVMQPTAYSKTLADVPDGFALFWGVRRV
jgi:peptide/nickel transport system substrate-binding protein